MYVIFSVEKDNIGKADEILKDNIVSRQSIVIRDASALGIDNENRYILIEGNEDAIKKAEELFKDAGKQSEKEATNEGLHKEAGKKVSEEEGVAEEKIEKTAEKLEKAEKLFKEVGKKVSEEEAAKIYDKIKKEEENAAEGVGFIFGE